MSDYIITNSELKHYGVIGMKWGVRRNPSKAYGKASKKLVKLNNKVEKKQVKARKKAERADNKEASWFASERSVRRADRKAKKAQRKAIRAVRKASKWYTSMEKEFAKTSISMTSEQAALGKKYIETLDLHAELRSLR